VRVRLSDLSPEYRAQARAAGASSASKYRNERVEFQGQKFDSRHELVVYLERQRQVLEGTIRAVIRQVSLPLPGTARRIRVDFAVVENDGRIRWEDAKGFDTPMGRLKRQQVKDAYGVEIELV